MCLALIFALTDCAEAMDQPLLEAARALWRYAHDCARYIFGTSLGDPAADALLAGLREAGIAGLTRTEITREIFGGNRLRVDTHRALKTLLEHGLVRSEMDFGGTTNRALVRGQG
jgi:hypothetical protein